MPNRTSNRYAPEAEPSSGLEARRQRTIDILTQAYVSDLINVEKYESRTALAASARLPRELDDLVSDLPSTRGTTARETEAREGERSYRRAAEPYRSSRSAYRESPVSVSCVMGDRRMTGNWLDSDRVNCFTVMGSTRLDLRDADLPDSGPVRIDAFVIMGETVVIVPRELPVRLTATPFMGEAVARRDVDQDTRGARRWVEISGLVVMGSVVVKAAD